MTKPSAPPLDICSAPDHDGRAFVSPDGPGGRDEFRELSPLRPRPSMDAVSEDDHQLIDACLAGRTEAFDRLVMRYQDRLYNTLLKMLGSADDARDIAQDAWVHAFQKLATFRGNSAFYSWLFRIAFNAAVSEKRKHRHPTASLDASRERTGHEPPDARPDGHPSHPMELAERQMLVQTALAQLSDEYRTVLVLKEMEDLKYEEIADMVGCPIGTVRSRIHRARGELREKLRILFRDDVR